jgi:hypothetical protein
MFREHMDKAPTPKPPSAHASAASRWA